MEVTANAPTAAGTALTGDQVQAQESIDETLDNFLLMLTTQLQHQDPLDPLDTAEFTGQLVGFSTVEQLIAANQKLDNLIAAQDVANHDDTTVVNPLDFIGLEVEVAGSGFAYDGNPATLAYQLNQDASLVSVTVLDALGEPVWETTSAPTNTGRHEVVWDGVNDEGETVPPGPYFVEVRAVDGAGIITQPQTFVSGVVTGVDTGSATPLLKVGDLFVLIEDITAVREPAPAAPAS